MRGKTANMSRIETCIEWECTDNKPSDCDWTLPKKDVALIAEHIKKLLIKDIRNRPHTFEDALEAVVEF